MGIRPWGWALILILGLSGTWAETTAASTEVTDNRITCYACGQADVDPTADGEAFCDLEKNPGGCPKASKMYNHTCDIMDRLGKSSNWERQCPEGIKSCFYSEANFEDQTPIFRGCAGAKYPHDEKCDRELQAVQVVAGKKSVDVEVLLCYCNTEKCNEQKNGSAKPVNSLILTFVLSALLAIIVR